MSDETKTKYVLELDSKQFIEATAGAKEHILSLGESSNLEGLITGLTRVSGMIGVIGVAVYGLKQTFEAVFEAENIKAVNAQFEMLAKNANLSGSALKESLAKAADGLIDDTDLLKIANQAILNMGSNAKRMGELMEASRKIAAGLGKDTKQVFEDLSRAIEFQNQKMFKSVGLNIDVEKAFKKYADSIGVGVAVLSQAEKQAALMAAAIDMANSKMGAGVGNVKQATNAWQQFKVAMSEIGESIILLWDRTVGPTVVKVFQYMTDAAKKFQNNIKASFGEGAEQMQAQITQLEPKALALKNAIDQVNQSGTAFYNGTTVFKSDLERLSKEYDQLTSKIIDTKAKLAATSEGGSAEAAEGVDTGPPPDIEKRQQAETKYRAERLQLEEQDLKQREEMASSEVEVEGQFAERRVLMQEEAAIKIEQIEQDKVLSAEQKAALKAQIQDNLTESLVQDEQKLAQAQEQALQRGLYQSTSVNDQMAKSAQLRAKQAGEAWKQSGGVGGLAITGFQNSFMTAMANIGQGTKSATEIMKGFFFGMIGSMASATGQFMVLDAFKGSLTGLPVINFPELAAGGAMITLGSFLSGMGSGGTSVPSGSGSGGSGDMSSISAAQATNTAQNIGQIDAAESQKKKSVTIQVMGNYFETDETKRRLVDIIRDFQDATDYRFIQIGHT